MNSIEASVQEILCINNLTHINFSTNSSEIDVLTLELQESIAVGSRAKLIIKSTDIALSKSRLVQSSFTNQLRAKVIDIDCGEILNSVALDIDGFILESLILNSKSLDIEVGDELFALISASDISIEYL